MLVQRALFSPICAAWNDGLRIDRVKMRNERVGVIRLVGRNAVWPEFTQQRQRLRAIPGLAAGEIESGQHAQPINQSVNLCAQAAPRSAQRLVAFFWARQRHAGGHAQWCCR